MPGSTLTGVPEIAENSAATPGLWNTIFGIISRNVSQLNSDASDNLRGWDNGSFHTLLTTTSRISTNTLGASSGNTIDVLSNISIGANYVWGRRVESLTSIYNAAAFGSTSSSVESRIQHAISQATTDGIARVSIPQSMLPYSARSVIFSTAVQMVREGGNWDGWDVKAYGATGGNGTADDTIAIVSAMSGAAIGTGSFAGRVVFPPETFGITRSLVVPGSVTLDLGHSTLSSSSQTVLLLNTYCAVVGDSFRANIISSSTVSGSLIASAATTAVVGGIQLQRFTLNSSDGSNSGVIGIDFRGIKTSVVRDVQVSECDTGIHVAEQGAVTAYTNVFDNVLVDSCRTGYQIRSGANEQVILGGYVLNTGVPFSAVSVSGLLCVGTRFEGYSVSGISCTDCNYVFLRPRLETAVSGLTQITHSGPDCIGTIIEPTFGDQATNAVYTISTGGLTFVTNGTVRVGGNTGTALIRVGGEGTADGVFEVRRGTVTNSGSIRWRTNSTLQWRLGQGEASSTSDLALYNDVAGSTALLVMSADNEWRFGGPVNLQQNRLLSMRTNAANSGLFSTLNANEIGIGIGLSNATLMLRSGNTVFLWGTSSTTTGA